MARPVILGNGSLTVGLDENGLVHDFYYPYVGLENLTTARSVNHKIGLWVDNTFSWVDDGWEVLVDFASDALVSKITMQSKRLQILLELSDFVDHEYNSFCRRITINNQADHDREIRIFLHQRFEISTHGRADTALYEPEENYILDYKGRCCLLIYSDNAGVSFDQYAVGNFGIEGKEGTYKDAEDGELSNSAVEHGGVDSVIRNSVQCKAGAKTILDYWVVATDSQYNAEKIHLEIKKVGLADRLQKTRQYWHDWLAIGGQEHASIPSEYKGMVNKSLMIIKAHTDKRGGIIASCDSSIYNYGRDYYSYVWPRDGAYAMWPLIRMGHTEEPKKFFEFCRDILTPEGFLMHKYQPDRAIGSTWHPLIHGKRKELAIQEDETAIIIYMLGEYHRVNNDKNFALNLYGTLIQPSANFLMTFIDKQTNLPHASYDLWEEKFLTTTYTAALVYQSLLVAADFAQDFEYPDDAVKWIKAAETILGGADAFFDPERKAFRKGFLLSDDDSLAFDNTLDISSMYGVMMYGLHTHDIDPLRTTVNLIENILLDQTPSGGSPRYEHDNYFRSEPPYLGNPWTVTTLWMAQYYARIDRLDKTKMYIDWAIRAALPSGVMSEQVNPGNGQPLSVTPLVWSHAELINTVLDLVKFDKQ